MSRQLPPIDLHAHISPEADPAELERLGAVVFAATRSIAEYESVRGRRDRVTIWGLGCHPGVPEAQSAFDPGRFAALLSSTAYVSEVGIDAGSGVPMQVQVQVLSSILHLLRLTPRITSIHSTGAPDVVLDALERHAIKGAVLHWWRGDETQSRRAIELGCWFSFNAKGMRYPTEVAHIPLERILTETDHPTGDRGSNPPRQPGAVADVEADLARMHRTTVAYVRQRVWANFVSLVDEVGVAALLPLPVVRMLAAARSPDSRLPS